MICQGIHEISAICIPKPFGGQILKPDKEKDICGEVVKNNIVARAKKLLSYLR
jgi:hypothetical protein